MHTKYQGIFSLILTAFLVMSASCTEPLISDQVIAPKHSITTDKSLLGCWQFKGTVSTDSLHIVSLTRPLNNNTTAPTTKPALYSMMFTMVIYPLDKNELLINMAGWPEFGVQVLTMRAWELQINGQTYLNCELFMPELLYNNAKIAQADANFVENKGTQETYIDSFAKATFNSMVKDGFATWYILARIQKTQTDSLDVFPLVFPDDFSGLPSKGFESGEQLEQFLISPAGQKLLSAKEGFGTDAMHFKRIDISDLPPELGIMDK